MNHGLKSLAQQLPQYGRYGDDMVAHISSDEARLLKSLGGSGTINPTTGLPEFFSIGNVFKPVQQAIGQLNPLNPGSAAGKAVGSIPGVSQAQNLATQVFQPIEKAVVQPASAGLASFDKMVGKAVPGGWGTVGQVALSMIPGAQPFAIGLGALNGSGVMHKGGKFNLQGAMMGGATAYATSELGEYLRAAGGAPDAALLPVAEGASPVSATAAEMTADEIAKNSANEMTKSLASESANVLKEVPQPYSMTENLLKGNFGDAASQLGTKLTEGASQIGTNIMNAPSDIYQAGVNAKDAIANYDYSNAINNATKGMSDTGSGLKNVLGLGEGTAKEAIAAGATSGVKALPMVGLAAYGTMSLADLDAQRKFLEEQKASGNIAQAEYNQAMAEINRSTENARTAVRENPFSTNPNRDASMDPTYYGRNNEIDNLYSRMKGEDRLYATGGTINPPDDQTGMPNESPLKNFEGGMLNSGGIMGYAVGGQIDMGGGYNPFANLPNLASPIGGRSPDDGPATSFAESHSINPPSNSDFNMNHIAGMAAGGMPPRFLSGGGDGMSDSIPAKINGKQEARLADGEFVIPADVVSHLGNGSSKAGANQLYSMMDKVRSARTGRKSQGKQINPRKYLPA